MVLVLVFAALVGIRYAAVLVLALLVIRSAQQCPACFAATLPIRRTWLRPFGHRFEWRWCPACGWQAIARRADRSR